MLYACTAVPLQLWLLHSPADAALWQRLVGLVATHQPHPDSWTGVLLGSPSRLQLLAASSIPPPPTAHKLYPAYHEEFEAQREMAAAMQEAGLLPADVASEYARTPAASWGGASHDSRSQGGASYGGAALQPSPSFQAAAEAAGVEQEAFELDAFHRQLSVGEELLEAAVHALLGIGRDSTDMLYMRTQLLMGAAWDRHQLQVRGHCDQSVWVWGFVHCSCAKPLAMELHMAMEFVAEAPDRCPPGEVVPKCTCIYADD